MSTENAAAAPMVEFRGVSKWFGPTQVLKEISLRVAPSEVVVIIGPSGSGKTTLLRCVSLLEDYEAGEIVVAGETVGLPDRGRRQARAPQRAGNRQCAGPDRVRLPEFQSVPAHDGPAQCRGGPDPGEEDAA